MPMRIFVDKETLEKELYAAEKAHGLYEKKLGKRDAKWPHWYAEFIIKRLKEKTSPKK